MNYFIITGTSRGLGEALVHKLIAPGNHLFCVSRSKSTRLESQGTNLDYYEFDLSNSADIDDLMSRMIGKIDESKAESLFLVNNAAIIAPLARIEKCEWEQINKNIHVNLIAPMALTSSFIKYASHLNIKKRVMNISSISARNMVSGMSCYSAAKSGLDTFTRNVGIEQGEDASAIRIASVWPGMMDTELQAEARVTDKETFAASQLFNKVKEHGMLVSPQTTADKLLEILLGEGFPQGAVIEDIYK